MISLRLVRLIELHSDELSAQLVAKLESSSRTSDLQKVPVEELRPRIQELLQHLSEWLLTKTGQDIERRYFEIGERLSRGCAFRLLLGDYHDQGASLGIPPTPGLLRGPIELFGEMELLRLLDQFFNRALCFATEGYEQYIQQQVSGSTSSSTETRAWH
ncbi:MAG: hypothetical protein ACRD23_00950 [Terriglobales bacterium]